MATSPNFSSSQPADWDSVHAENLKAFLTSDSGQLALAWVSYFAPALLDGSDVNRTLVASGEVKGYTAALSNLLALTREAPQPSKPAQEEFPDLEDDSKWDQSQNQRPS